MNGSTGTIYDNSYKYLPNARFCIFLYCIGTKRTPTYVQVVSRNNTEQLTGQTQGRGNVLERDLTMLL